MKHAKFKRDFSKDMYSGLKGIYFNRILKKIIEIGDLKNRDVKILDFGCGTGRLKQLLGNKVINYDIQSYLSEVKDWRRVKFDVIAVNQVFYLIWQDDLRNLLRDFYKINPKAELIVGISRMGFINRILRYLSGDWDAWVDAKTRPNEELRILKERLNILKKKSVFFMTDIYLMKFKKVY